MVSFSIRTVICSYTLNIGHTILTFMYVFVMHIMIYIKLCIILTVGIGLGRGATSNQGKRSLEGKSTSSSGQWWKGLLSTISPKDKV